MLLIHISSNCLCLGSSQRTMAVIREFSMFKLLDLGVGGNCSFHIFMRTADSFSSLPKELKFLICAFFSRLLKQVVSAQ